MKTLIARIGKLLWIATTPIALTFLLAQPEGKAQEPHAQNAAVERAPAEHGEGEHGAAHGPDGSPIKNFVDFSYSSKDVNGGTLEPGEEHMPPPFSMALFNFGVLVFLVGKFAGPKLVAAVRDRHEAIDRALAEGERLMAEAQRRHDEYTARIKNLDAEVAEITAGLKKEADLEKERIIAEAEARAERMRKDAEQMIKGEIARVREMLEREAGFAALAIAEKMIRERATDGDHKSLQDNFLKTVQATKPAA